MNQTTFASNYTTSSVVGGSRLNALFSVIATDLAGKVLANEYLITAGIFLIFGAVSTVFYYLYYLFLDLFQRAFIVTVTIENTSELFDWLVRWLSEQEQSKSFLHSTTTTLQVYVKKFTTMDFWDNIDGDDSASTSIELLPGPGDHIVRFKNKSVWVSRANSSKVVTVGHNNRPFVKEYLSLSIYGRDHTLFTDLFDEARKMSMMKDNEKTRIYTLHEYGYKWVLANAKDPRSFESVILDTNMSQSIADDATEFLTSKDWYLSVGLPYRRGYLLYGPPGCGKTSFVSALAAKMNLSICCLTLSNDSLDDQSLNERLHDAPGNAIILLEDIDSVFIERNVADSHSSRVTFSGLLNSIDGVASQEGRLFFMTTNHIEKLDPALLRPGRCDVRCEFKRASKKQISDMFSRFYPLSEYSFVDEKLVNKLLNSIPEYTVPMAALQEHFMRYREDPKKAVERYHEILAETQNDSSDFLITSDDADKNTKDETLTQIESTPESRKEIFGDELLVWLTRLGFSKHIAKFREKQIYDLSDMKDIEGADLEEFDFKQLGDRERLMGMLQGRKDVVADFEYATTSQLEKLFMIQFQNDTQSEKLSAQFVAALNGVAVSIHQVKDHLFQHANDIQAAVDSVSILRNPPQSVEDDEKVKKIFDKDMSIREWITSAGPKHLASLDTELKEQIINNFAAEEIITLEDLLELSMPSDLKEIAKVEKKGIILAFERALEELKKNKEKVQAEN